jgi:RNA-binding protein
MSGLTGSQRTYLRGLAHHQRPAVQVGREGLTDAVLAAIETALVANELIKVRLPGERQRRKQLAAEIDARLGSECVGLIGGIAIVYRENLDAGAHSIRLPR